MSNSLSQNNSHELNDELVTELADLLGVEAAQIHSRPDATFVQLGGDSVKALQLTFQLDSLDISLDLDAVLDSSNSVQKLSQIIAASTHSTDSQHPSEYGTTAVHSSPHEKPFELVADTASVVREAASQIECSTEDIEDIFPVTSQQKLLWLASLKQPDAYIAHWCFDLPGSVDLERLKTSWRSVLEASPALRMRFFLDSKNALYQAVVASGAHDWSWNNSSSESSATIVPGYGKPLAGYTIESLDSKQIFHLYAHHSLYDRWSIRLIFDDVRQAYSQAKAAVSRPSFIPFLAPLPDTERAQLRESWREFIGKSFLTPVPDLAPVESPSGSCAVLEKEITLPLSYATKAELVTAAWSWVCSRQSNASDVSFGLTIWGRDISLRNITQMAIPTFHTLPICVHTQPDNSVGEFLGQIKSTLGRLRSIQRLGFEEIASINEICRRACHYNSIVVVQSEEASIQTEQCDVMKPEDMNSFDLRQGHPLVLECSPHQNTLSICLRYAPDYLAPEAATPLLFHFCTALKSLSRTDVQLCNEIDLFGEEDERSIRQWVRPCEDRKTTKMYSMIEERARESPDAPAVWTTDSTTTYGQLLCSAKSFAHIIRSKRINGHVGLCFERSTLAIVAQMGISLSGCAFVPMDPANPAGRLKQIVQNSHMRLLICSNSVASKCGELSVPLLVLNQDIIYQPSNAPNELSDAPANSSDTAYMIFTSGSTGTPKGVVIQHEQVSTSLNAQIRLFGAGPQTRTLQFSSLAFDVSIHEIYMTLSAGGTVCIPNESERFELAGFLTQARPNYAMLTPSVAATLSDESLALISEIALCGEPLRKGQIGRVLDAGSQPWVVYGPTETSIINLGHKADASTSRYNLGYSFGSTSWIIDVEDPHKLAPIGMPGELAFSGHTLAAGYYQDAEKTNAAFRTGLKWTQRFPDQFLERVYLTGDLARYNPNGTIQFLGRIRGYTKIAGNRVDLDEIHHLLTHECELLEVCVLICQVKGQNEDRDMLLCFFADQSAKARQEDCELGEPTSNTRSKVAQAIRTLKQSLPGYMIPSAFLPVNKIPLTTGGKLAASVLRRLLDTLDIERLQSKYGMHTAEDGATPASSINDTDGENHVVLSDAWASVLSIPASSLSPSSHFMKMGGDSLRAMELAGVLRRSHMSLLVADIVKTPLLRDMAGKIRRPDAKKAETRPMFSDAEYDRLVKAATETFQVSRGSIQSLSPCSSLQTQMLAASERVPGGFVHRDCFQLRPEVSRDEVQDVCYALMERNELLRTRVFVDPQTARFVQVVLSCDTVFELRQAPQNSAQSLDDKSKVALGLGHELCRFTMAAGQGGASVLVWDMHHCIYDGHSHKLLLNRLQALIKSRRNNELGCQSRDVEDQTPTYHDFIRFVANLDKRSASEFWLKYLDGAQHMDFNIINPPPNTSLTNARATSQVQVAWPKSVFTISTYIRSAFALVLSRYSASSDVNFAATVNGRDLPLRRIEDIAGPTFSTIPVRVQLDPKEPLQALLSRLQQDFADCAQHQTLPLEDIKRISQSCKDACQFQTHLLIQPQDLRSSCDSLASLGYESLDKHSAMQLQMPFNLVATIEDSGVELEAVYDDAAVQNVQVELMLDQLSTVLQQVITSNDDVRTEDVLSLGKKNSETIMATQPELENDLSSASTIPELVFRSMQEAPDSEAVHSSHTSLTYRELYTWSYEFSRQLTIKYGSSRQMLAFCFEKSTRAIVAQLGILIAGHAFVPIDPSWPQDRCKSVIQQTESPVLVSSPTLAGKFATLDIEVMVVGDKESKSETESVPPTVDISSVAYVLFTSGSTGTPKGVVVEHGSITRTLKAYARRLGLSHSTRALLFASFTFDASVMETWSVLAAGGTLCVADEDERISDLNNFIVRSRCNCAGLTPTAAGLLNPQKLTSLKTLLFCGEQCREIDRSRWQHPETLLVNGYGPTEACVNAATNTRFRSSDIDDIGTTLGGGLWIVNPENVDEVFPVGCTGELVVSGPVLASGYLKAPKMTAERFVHPRWPDWTRVNGGRVFRTGDLAWLDAQGRLHIAGRNDGQMKINGIRVECGEIESALQKSDANVTDVVASTFLRDGDMVELAAYFVPDNTPAGSTSGHILPLGERHPAIIAAMNTAAKDALPAAFVPAMYIPVSRIPQSTSGKADRKLLAHSTSALHPSQLALYRAGNDHQSQESANDEPSINNGIPRASLSESERALESMWSTVLGFNPTSSPLNSDSHFIEVGGDSIAAIRLSAVGLSKGVDLPVNVIYAKPRLSDMAMALGQGSSRGERTLSTESPEAFEMLDDMEILSPVIEKTPSPLVTRTRRGGYFEKSV